MVKLITRIRENIKNHFIDFINKNFIFVCTISRFFKNYLNLWYSQHSSPINFLVNPIYTLAVYYLTKNIPKEVTL